MAETSGVEREKLLRVERLAAERTVNQVAPPPGPGEGGEPLSPLVRGAEPVRGAVVDRDRGARTHRLAKKERKKAKAAPDPRATPPDPGGRGRSIDFRA